MTDRQIIEAPLWIESRVEAPESIVLWLCTGNYEERRYDSRQKLVELNRALLESDPERRRLFDDVVRACRDFQDRLVDELGKATGLSVVPRTEIVPPLRSDA